MFTWLMRDIKRLFATIQNGLGEWDKAATRLKDRNAGIIDAKLGEIRMCKYYQDVQTW